MATYSNYPKAARNAAKRALKHKKENGTSCGTPVGWNRATDIAAGRGLSLSTVKRTFSFLSRSKTYDQGRFTDDKGKDICGSIMYAAWGGDSMKNWCESIINKEDRMNNSNTEIRYEAGNVEVRAYNNEEEKSGRKLTGYAVRFNDVTTIGNQFKERVSPSAFEGVNMSNTLALWNHNYDEPVGRAGKNLDLSVDDKGLRFDIDLPDTTRGNDIAELVRTGVVGGMSFGFTIRDDEWNNEGEMPTRTINQIEDLFEITFTPIPAYPTTEVAMRSLEAAMETSEDVAEIVESATNEETEDTILNNVPTDTEEAPAAEVKEETAEVTDEVADANSEDNSGESTEESEPLATTKEDIMKFLLGL